MERFGSRIHGVIPFVKGNLQSPRLRKKAYLMRPIPGDSGILLEFRGKKWILSRTAG
jgi:hypothetical protein